MTLEGQQERTHCPAHTVPVGISQAVGGAFLIFWEDPSQESRHLEIMHVTLSPSLRSRVNSAKGLA